MEKICPPQDGRRRWVDVEDIDVGHSGLGRLCPSLRRVCFVRPAALFSMDAYLHKRQKYSCLVVGIFLKAGRTTSEVLPEHNGNFSDVGTTAHTRETSEVTERKQNATRR